MPSPASLPALLAKLGIIKGDDLTPAEFDDASRRSNDVPTPTPSPYYPVRQDWPSNALASGILSATGLWPKMGEPLGSYWGREWGNTIPPSLREPLGRDIALPTDVLKKKATR